MRRFSKTIGKDVSIGKRLHRIEEKVSVLEDKRYALTNLRVVPLSKISIQHSPELKIQYEIDNVVYSEDDCRFLGLSNSSEYGWIYKTAIGDIFNEWMDDYSNESIFTILRLKMFEMLSEEMSQMSPHILSDVHLAYYPGTPYAEMLMSFQTTIFRFIPTILERDDTSIKMHFYNKHHSIEETYTEYRRDEFMKLYPLWVMLRDDIMKDLGIPEDTEDYTVED